MRLFEVLLILINVPFILWGFVPKSRPVWVWVLPGLSVVFTSVHLLVEGYRWQMVPAYVMVAILAGVALRPFLPTYTPNHSTHILGAVFGLLLLLAAAALPTLLPVPKFLPTTGPFAIGTTTLYQVDETRAEIYTDAPNDHRELMMQIWYPAEQDAPGAKAVYLESLDVAGPAIADFFELPSFLLNHVNLTKLDIVQDAPVAASKSPFPIILFSHGLAGIRMQGTTMVRELVSHGYVVAAVDHTYANAFTSFPDGRVIFYDPYRLFTDGDSNPEEANTLVNQWAGDLGFMLDQLTVWNEEEGNRFNGRLNPSSVGVFGHSTGGGTTVEFCMKNGRCNAAIALDSWVLPVSDGIEANGLTQPVMFISSPRWLGEDNAARGQRIFNNNANDAYCLTLANTAHYDFTDIPLLSPLTPQLGLSGSIDSRYSLKIQNEYMVGFFNRYLKNHEAPILIQPSPYPELDFVRKPAG